MGLRRSLIELRDEQPDTSWLSRSMDDGPAEQLPVEDALRSLAEFWLNQMQASDPGAGATFYCWYDEQAGQLRLSVTRQPPTRLPFGVPVEVVGDPGEVVRLALGDPSPGVIPRNEMEPVFAVGEAEVTVCALKVWAVSREGDGSTEVRYRSGS